MSRKRRIPGWAALLALVTAFPAAAQEWLPSKPVRIIVPIAGGTVDTLGRIVAPRLQEVFGQPVIVENKAGAGGTLGTDFVAKSPPDGHTILVSYTGPITINATLFDKLPYDPQKDLTPIMLALGVAQFLVVHPSLPVQSFTDFVRYARERPGKLSYGSIGVGGASHLTMEMLKSAAGIDLVHVPYKGSAPAMTDLLAGQVQAAIFVASNALPHMKTGKMKALAATSRRRMASAPDVPTMIESGYPDLEAVAWSGFHAPGATPRPIIDRYNRELARILRIPEVRDRLLALEFEIIASTPEYAAEYFREETRRWAKVIRDTGAKPE